MGNVIDESIVKSAIVKRKADAHKYSIGSLLSICGSYGMTGAAVMSGRAALRSGIGLLRMVVPESIYPIMAQAVPEAVFSIIRNDNFSFSEINGKNCILMGCGLSTSDFAQKLVKDVVQNADVPMVLDADALNIISKDISILQSLKVPVIVTPHHMEMARLVGVPVEKVAENREQIALDFAKKYGVITVLKSDKTVVASPDGRVAWNTLTGNPGMAVGGSGDVLAGVMASLVAQGGDLFSSACAAVYIHGLAGDIAKEKFGEISMLPTDIIDCLPEAFIRLGKN